MKKIIIIATIISFGAKLYSQVNLQTGSATFNLPMFNWQDNKSSLNFNIGLNYNSGNGLKVDEVASNIGQGWDLLAGGVISRMQVGEPDDQVPYITGTTENTGDIYKYPAGYLYNTVSASTGCPNALAFYPIFGDQDHVYKQHNVLAADREQDYFSFQFNGRGGVFVLGKNNGDKGILAGDSKVKISFQRSATTAATLHSRTTIVSFTIQDENGLLYTFGQIGMSKVLKMHPSLPAAVLASPPQLPNRDKYYESAFDEIPDVANPYIINSWYLTQIQDPLTNRIISLNYETRSLTNFAGDIIERSKSHLPSYTSSSGGQVFTIQITPVPEKNGYITMRHNISKTVTPFITSVQYPDGYKATFNYDIDRPRFDFAGDLPMKSVNISYNGRVVSDYQLNTTYFIFNNYGTPVTQSQKIASRLCLKSVQKSIQKFGAAIDMRDKEPPYVFDYYMGSNASDDFVPPPFYYAKDIWGYYNGGNINGPINNTPAIPILTTQLTDISTELYNFSTMQLGALCFFGYNPSNVSLPYNYNTIKFGFAKNGLLKSIIFPTGGKLEYQYEQNFKNEMFFANSNLQVAQSSITGIDLGGGVHVLSTSQTDGGYSNSNLAPIKTFYKFVNQTSAQTSQWGYETPNNIFTTSTNYIAEGGVSHFLSNCTYDYQYPGIPSREHAIATEAVQQSFQVWSFLENFIVSQIHDFIYAGFASYEGILLILANLVFNSCDGTLQIRQNKVYQNSNIAYNNLPIQFSRVEVFASSNLPGTGKTVYEFTDFRDYGIWGRLSQDNSDYNRFAMNQRAAPWAYGLPKRISVYDENGNIIKQTENIYDWSKVQRNAGTDISCDCYVYQTASMRSDSWANLMTPANVQYNTFQFSGSQGYGKFVQSFTHTYQIFTGRVELKDTYTRIFKPADANNYLETKTHFDYNANNYQLSKATVTQSNGDKNIKEIYYPGDFTAPGILQTLTTNNIVNMPVATYSSVIKYNTTTPVYLGASVTDFSVLSNGDIKPSRTLIGRTKTPLAGFVFDPANQFNFPGLVQTQTFTYDASANLKGLKDEGNHVITNLYDYNDKFIAATVINADPLLDKPAYSSFETYNDNGWTISGTSSRGGLPNPGGNLIPVVTGRSVLFIDPTTIITAPINPAKPYIISYWASNGPLIVSNATLNKTGPVVNGYTFYEYTIPENNNTVTITNTAGNNTIDELRLYPKNSRMRTVSYDQLIGKTSECDENNRLTYYEYDELWRLRFIKDDANNIVKMYEYNIDNTITYQSAAKSQTFTKSCAAGYAYSLDYSVPAGTYTSVISQDNADAKAQNDININGQAEANAGTCTAIPPVTVYCTFTPAINWGYIAGTISATGNAVSFYIVEQNTNNYTSWTSPTLIATITGSCKPSANRTISYTENARTWNVTFTVSGELYIQLVSGTAPAANFTFAMSNGTFAL
jgi:hypothetical protein